MIRIGGDGPRRVEPVVPIRRTGDKLKEDPARDGAGTNHDRNPDDQPRERPKPKPGEPGYKVDIQV